MSKLTKKEIQLHEQALKYLQKEHLSEDEKAYVYENYQESANHINSKVGAFFTPLDLANDFTLHIPYKYDHTIKVVDLCAGIGTLSYAATLRNSWDKCGTDITCVEINPDYVEIGKRLLPEANWICGDALDPDLLRSLGTFNVAISNPPYGNIPSNFKKIYKGQWFEYMVIEAASQIADEGVFLIPQMSAPFTYSGRDNHQWLTKGRAIDFQEKTGITLDFNIGVDTSVYKDSWHGVAPTCEIVCCDFTEKLGQLAFAV